MGVTNYLLKGIILQVGPRVFFSKYGVACFKTQQNGSGGIFQEKTTWMSVRTLLGNSIGQIRSIWKLNYDILNVFVAVLVKHVIDNLKKKIIATINIYIYIWHILHLAWISPKRYISPPSPKKIRRIIKVLLPISQVPNKEHSCQVELRHTCLQGGWNQHWNPEVRVDKLSGRAEVWWYTPEIQ